MKVKLMPGIASISGKMGKTKDGHRLEFRTYKRPDGKNEVRLYSIPKQTRKKPLSEAEIQARSRFAKVAAEVTKRIKSGDTRSRREIFKEIYAQWFHK